MKSVTTQQEFAKALEACDSEPIHVPGIIQPFGALLAFDIETEVVAYASDNAGDVFDLDDAKGAVLGQNLQDLFDRDLRHNIRNRIATLSVQPQRMLAGTHQSSGQIWEVFAFQSGDYAVLEFEPAAALAISSPELLAELEQLVEALRTSNEEQAILQRSVDLLRLLSGYDRVMAYRFDADNNGEVIAESRKRKMEPYLGLRFPHWDIPKQAREIMAKIPLRMIADVDAAPVAIEAANSALPPLDITMAHLRGVSDIHLAYLRNMGSKATMTLSIVVEGRLWGILSFHHSRPRIPDAKLKQISLALLPTLTTRLALCLRESELQVARDLDVLRVKTRKEFDRAPNLREALDAAASEILPKLNAAGIMIHVGDAQVANGLHLGEPYLSDLVKEALHSKAGLVAKDRIAFPDEVEIPEIAGAIVVAYSKDKFVAIFRQPIGGTVQWAGAPQKDLEWEGAAPRLTPRGSFETYLEEVVGQSQPWSSTDIQLMQSLSDTFISALEMRTTVSSEYARQQALMIDELNHRVKNTLTLIRSISREARKNHASPESYGKALEMRISALAAAHELGEGRGLEAISALKLLAVEMLPYRQGHDDRFEILGTDAAIRAEYAPFVALVVHELVTNAAKYGALRHNGILRVVLSESDGGLKISWHESGAPPLGEPNRSGFGLTLIRDAIPFELNGRAEVHFTSSGLEAEFWLPPSVLDTLGSIEHHTDVTIDLELDSLQTNDDRQLGSILLVEDNFIIASDMTSAFQGMGFDHVETVSNVSDALEYLVHNRPTVACLDVNLGSYNDTSVQVADRLSDLSVPFVFVTGYGELLRVPERHKARAVLTKPVSISNLRKAILSLCE